jgi:hypothetical protein
VSALISGAVVEGLCMRALGQFILTYVDLLCVCVCGCSCANADNGTIQICSRWVMVA